MPVSYEIHPSIGVARVGSSRLAGLEGSFLGPEPGVRPPDAYRDRAGDLKRQAARFRVFRCVRDEHRRLVEASELDLAAAGGITWTVHLANRKGIALRQGGSGPGNRNRAGGGEADGPLIIDAGPASVARPGDRAPLDGGRFRSTRVPLGEIAMDPDGRLVVLGGHGRSGSDPHHARLDPIRGHRCDNDDWFDDTSDGPVTATIGLGGGSVAVAGAWVIVGPPDFAPGVTNQVTLYDFLSDLAARRGLLEAPARPSFARDIRPILARAMGYRWVNRAAYFGSDGDGRGGHGAGGTGDFSGLWEALADPSGRSEPLRRSIAERLRDPAPGAPIPAILPLRMIPRLTAPQRSRDDGGNVLPLTAAQYEAMRAWARGDFEPDLGRAGPAPELLPDALDRMALEACVGGALDPGIEAGPVVLGDPARYLEGEPFRLSHAAVRPGEVTGPNAVPWQADFLACRWEELDGPWPKRLAWWPAQRPDDVFPEVGAAEMVPWARGVGEEFQDMIEKWDRLGFVVERETPDGTFFAEGERDVGALGP